MTSRERFLLALVALVLLVGILIIGVARAQSPPDILPSVSLSPDGTLLTVCPECSDISPHAGFLAPMTARMRGIPSRAVVYISNGTEPVEDGRNLAGHVVIAVETGSGWEAIYNGTDNGRGKTMWTYWNFPHFSDLIGAWGRYGIPLAYYSPLVRDYSPVVRDGRFRFGAVKDLR